ncbi:MAG: hypothetical protein OEY16_06935 [Alphaproteobacteria bacterium]|nr:hypothetical protein [Alphaproteobacteria bacterium]
MEAWDVYDEFGSFYEPTSIAKWVDLCVYSYETLALRVGLKPFTILQAYSSIDDTGEFTDDPDFWFSPDELEQSVEGFVSKMGMNDPDAMVMCEYWVREIRTKGVIPGGTGPMPKILPGEDPYRVGLWRTQALGLLISNMEGMVRAARACREKGIERLAFGTFG